MDARLPKSYLARAGFSIIELMVGVAVSAIVTAGAGVMMTHVAQMSVNDRLERLLNQVYFEGVQLANNPMVFTGKTLAGPGFGLTAADVAQAKGCLATIGQNCKTLEAKGTIEFPPGTLAGFTPNVSYNLDGTCVDTDPSCLVTRKMSFQFVCPNDNYCTGLRLDVKASPITLGRQPADVSLRGRAGSFVLPARQFQSKGEVAVICPSDGQGKRGLFGIDYTAMTDKGHCATYDSNTNCAMPMNNYNTGSNCRPTQTTNCGDGYTKVGLFNDQSTCIGAYVPTPPPSPDPTNGACGADNGASLASAPTGLCSAGTPSAVSGAGPWAWTCAGTNGGATASCAAQNNAACGDYTYADPQAVSSRRQNGAVTMTVIYTSAVSQIPANCQMNGITINLRAYESYFGSCTTPIQFDMPTAGTPATNGCISCGGSGSKTWWTTAVWNGDQTYLTNNMGGWGSAAGAPKAACLSDVVVTVHSKPK